MRVIKLALLAALMSVATCTSYDPVMAGHLYNYSQPTYCNISKLSVWDCDPCQVHPNIQELQVFYNQSHSAQGYCAYDPDMNAIILAIRGTEEQANWKADFDYIKTAYGTSGAQVHQGFLRVYEDLANNLLACAYSLNSNHPEAPIYVTGHSLGAASSTFAALDINNLIKPIAQFYNFGQPRVGNAAFKTLVETQLSHLFIARITHYKDEFVHLPTKDQGFVHFGNEVYYSDDSTSYSIYGSEDKNGADQYIWPWQWTTKDHLFYFRQCAGCQAEACAKYA